MANELIINASLPETRIALLENGEIQELLIERASGKGIVGNIYKGRVTRVLPGMQAAFVEIGEERAGFLYVDDVTIDSTVWEAVEEATPPSPLAEANVSQMEEQGGPESIRESLADEQSSHPTEETKGAPEAEPGPEEISEEENLALEDLDEEDDEDSDPEEPALMSKDPNDPADAGRADSPDTIEAPADASKDQSPQRGGEAGGESKAAAEGQSAQAASGPGGAGTRGGNKRHRRGRRGSRYRTKRPGGAAKDASVQAQAHYPESYPENYPQDFRDQVADEGNLSSDRSVLGGEVAAAEAQASEADTGRPASIPSEGKSGERRSQPGGAEFRAQRSRDRRIKQKPSSRTTRPQVNIQDLLKEGQEVLVQVAKDPIATKGARLTCHISLPGRHLVCMPTIDHVGVSRRIERDEERRRLREFVEKNRPRNLGFIVRTASGKQQSEKRIKQDIDYLTKLWNEIREKAASVTAPALVYEDLNSVLRAIRDWVTEEIDKVIVDSRYHHNEILRFVSHFMPPLKQKIELYHGDIPIFDAYGISTELSRALERKVWLKSGGYIVVDQAEALVAIDVNTGRFVGRKNLEDTILKTNLEAVQEIAYQLRLRNCGGIIIIDLIDMEKDENKHRVYRALEDALAKDRARPTILKISELGLIEMTRKRTRDTIVRSLCESCTHCEGKGFIKNKQTVAYEVMREVEREGIERDIGKILVQAHPEVIDILAIDERDTLDQLEKRYRKMIYLQAVADFHPEQFEVTAEKRERQKGQISPREAQREQRESRDHREKDKKADDRPRPSRGKITPPASPTIVPPSVTSTPLSAEPTVVSDSSTLANPPQEIAPSSQGEKPAEDDFDEEDRLAFLRAQAAQDAALARLNSGMAPPTTMRNMGEGSNNRGERGAPSNRRNPRNRRGKFRRGNDRNRSGKPYGFQGNQKKPDAKEAAPAVTDPAGSGSKDDKPDEGGSNEGQIQSTL